MLWYVIATLTINSSDHQPDAEQHSTIERPHCVDDPCCLSSPNPWPLTPGPVMLCSCSLLLDSIQCGIFRYRERTAASKPMVESPVMPSAIDPVPNPRRILIIDDSRDAAHTLKMLLGKVGHQVEVATDGASGIAAARRSPPEIVFCDIGMPGMDGYQVAEALARTRQRATPTSSPSPDMAKTTIRSKPCNRASTSI